MVAFAAGHGIPIKSVRPSPVIINLTDRPLHSSGGVCVCVCVLFLHRTHTSSCSPLVCTQSWQGSKESGTNIQQLYCHPLPWAIIRLFIQCRRQTSRRPSPPSRREFPTPTEWTHRSHRRFLFVTTPIRRDTSRSGCLRYTICGIPRASEFAGEGTKILAFVPVCFVFELDIWLLFSKRARLDESENILTRYSKA